MDPSTAEFIHRNADLDSGELKDAALAASKLRRGPS
jgi:hypothetical protein